MTTPWVLHVKQYAKDHNCSYKQALKLARPSYKSNAKSKKKQSMRGAGAETEPEQMASEKEVMSDTEEVPPPPAADTLPPSPPPPPPTPKPKPKKKSLIEKILPLRQAGKLPPASRKLLAQVGNEPITSLMVSRSPLNKSLINFITLGKYKPTLKKLNYDDTFHLRLVINGRYTLEKNEVVRFEIARHSALTDSMIVPLPAGFNTTINELIEKTRQYMGDHNFSRYDVARNNCQVFVSSVLKANNLGTPEIFKFVNQDVAAVYKGLPKYAKKTTDFFTTLKARLGRLTEGEGMKGGAVTPRNLQYYITQLRRIKRAHPEQWTDMFESVLRDFIDIYRMIRDDQMEFTQAYLEDVLQSGQQILNNFPSGREEMKE